MVTEFFSTENFGMNPENPKLLSENDKTGLKIMQETIKRVDQRYEIGLLWKEYPPKLPGSYAIAEKGLFSLEKRMLHDDEFAVRYTAKIDKYIQKGYARKLYESEIDDKSYPIWYLPHFGVVNPHKPTKVRVVFDAAAKTMQTSLNSALVKGPEQAKPLLNILLQFRHGIIGVAADSKEMFSQVKIRKDDQQAQRFLWRNGDTNKPIEHYTMTSMIFGAICSPCCAEFVKNQNAKDYAIMFPEAANAVINKHYVDDFV